MGKKIISLNHLISRTVERYQNKRRSQKVGPEGFFSVHVGSDRERFLVHVSCLNHPSFKILLEDAESEFGFGSGEGPLVLPCDVDLFYRVLAEMECGGDGDDDLVTSAGPGCGFGCSPVRLKSCRSGSYSVLAAPSRLISAQH